MAQQSIPKPGDLVGPNYQIVSQVGTGGFGVVFEAVNTSTRGRVALKWLNPELSRNRAAVERFRAETLEIGRLQHPNVVPVQDIGGFSGALFLVMELLRGQSLRARIARGPLSPREATNILLPVMRGVAAAHRAGVLHRDIKPENIFLTQGPDGLDMVPKILDFGIARLSSDSEGAQRNTVHTGFLGTYPFMAFEQLHARGELDVRVDVYALGAVMYNMVTGQLPYEADNSIDLALRMLQSEPLPATHHVPTLPEALDMTLRRALARERSQRHPSVESLAAALEPFAESTPARHSRPVSAINSTFAPASQEAAGTPQTVLAAPSLPPKRPPAFTEGGQTAATRENLFQQAQVTRPGFGTRKMTLVYASAGALVAVLVGAGVSLRFLQNDNLAPPPSAAIPAPGLPSVARTPDPGLQKATGAMAPEPALAPPPTDEWEEGTGTAVEDAPALAPPVRVESAGAENPSRSREVSTAKVVKGLGTEPSKRGSGGKAKARERSGDAPTSTGKAHKRSWPASEVLDPWE